MKKLLVSFFPLLLIFSCATSIENLKAKPAKYVGQIVPVKGVISKALPIPFTDFKIFELKDSTDNIILFSEKGFNEGDEVRLTTKVIGFDTTNQEESVKQLVSDIKDFVILNSDLEESKVQSISETISSAIVKIVKPINGTYFLIDKTE